MCQGHGASDPHAVEGSPSARPSWRTLSEASKAAVLKECRCCSSRKGEVNGKGRGPALETSRSDTLDTWTQPSALPGATQPPTPSGWCPLLFSPAQPQGHSLAESCPPSRQLDGLSDSSWSDCPLVPCTPHSIPPSLSLRLRLSHDHVSR